jgi:hypothetical protein
MSADSLRETSALTRNTNVVYRVILKDSNKIFAPRNRRRIGEII